MALPFSCLRSSRWRSLLPSGLSPEEERGGFGEGPLEVLVAHLGAAAGFGLAVGRSVALDQAGVGEEVLDPREAVDSADLLRNGPELPLVNTKFDDLPRGVEAWEVLPATVVGRRFPRCRSTSERRKS